MSNKSHIIDLIKSTALELIKEAAGPRSSRRGTDVTPAAPPAAPPVPLTPPAAPAPDAPIVPAPAAKAPLIPLIPPDLPSTIKSDDSTDPIKPKTAPSGKVQPGNSPQQIATAIENVKEMQIAMQNLAQSIIADSESSTMANKPKDAQQPHATGDVKTAKKSFNDFIAEQYLGSLDEDKKGVEWTKDTHITTLPGKQKSQTDIYELDVVMDTLRRVGASTKEFVADGKWDFRTDNALRNIMGFAYALLQLEGDFGLENNTYTFDHWKNLNKALSGYKIGKNGIGLNAINKNARAIAITKHLRAITKLYSHFRQQVLARPEFRPTIEGKRSFDRYSPQGTNKDSLTEPEDQMSKSDAIKIPVTYIAPGLPNKKLDYIPLKALRNKEEYIKWMVGYAGNTEASAINIFNKVIKPKIETT